MWTAIAGLPVAFEPPSAGFVLDWRTVAEVRAHGAGFATLTHAAGISPTGDVELDRRLPFDEPYRIPESTAFAIEGSKAPGGRIIAIGTALPGPARETIYVRGKLVLPGMIDTHAHVYRYVSGRFVL